MPAIVRYADIPVVNTINVAPIHAPDYGPIKTTCPSDTIWLRKADSLGSDEQAYITKRADHLATAWTAQTERVGLDSPPRTPVVAMALSGGGYRAMLSGSGMAFAPQTHEEGDVGDILGLSTYVSGLSGGSWAVASFYANDGTSPQDLVEDVWHLDDNLIAPGLSTFEFYTDIKGETKQKEEAGFVTQITDLWALALTDQLFPEQWRSDSGHPNLAWSDLKDTIPRIQEATLPYPIIVALEREPDQPKDGLIATNSTIFEFTLSEFGSWRFAGSQPGGFTPMEYLGTKLENGKPQNGDECVVGFDNAGFVVGTSASVFNMAMVEVSTANVNTLLEALKTLGKFVLNGIGKHNDDVTTYVNPFYGWDTGEDVIGTMENITLVDGGEASENIPLEPFLQPARQVDAIIAFDNSDNLNGWPTGKSLYVTYEKARNHSEMYGTPSLMPQIPSPAGFINQGLNSRPTFFGCNDTQLPIVIYIPNYPYTYQSNQDTFKLDYSKEDALGMIENGRRVLNLNGTISSCPKCLTCALMDNAVMEKEGATRSSECQTCFDAFCWNGMDDQSEPADYNPMLGASLDSLR